MHNVSVLGSGACQETYDACMVWYGCQSAQNVAVEGCMLEWGGSALHACSHNVYASQLHTRERAKER
eukprot:960393-Pelagomonas_calceolata.AAC.1